MSPVDVAMVGGGLLQQTKRALGLARRDILIDAADRVGDVRSAFSSWDNCMKHSYCKWPVIAVIVVGSLILFSLVWCIIRRLCCGLACCCSCCQCLRCCGNCCGCCDAPNRRQHKYLEEPYIPPGHGYQTQPPMQAPFASGATPPQYAQFDMPRKGGEDALPEMPSWESGSSKRVMVENDEVEMNQLNKPSSLPLAQTPATVMTPALASTPGYDHHSPASYPRDQRGYFDQGANHAFDLAQPTPRGPSRPYNLMHQDSGDSFGRMGGGPSPYPMDARARADYGQYPSPTPAPRERADYGPTGYSSAGYDTGYNTSYDTGYDTGYDMPTHSSPPVESWSPQNQQSSVHHSPPITNNAGFDFTSGYARPALDNQPASEPPSTSTPVYPGYKPYQPPTQAS
ncbi:hypothetical protein XA68_18129 [Ophiocordyceps unilateralis]|uniref:Fibroin-3 n=1 Tax=Ophiocordyceps unilateralis TaxID=268505 RepID=A0A2A9P216_OPHUN|nr:hypothetical protein XA68_18129 [Ophiocordyceps unilateralis]